VLILQQPPHQLRARILHLARSVRTPRQQHLRFDPYQRRGQLQKLARPVQTERLHTRDRLQELPRDLRDRNVENVNVLFPDQVQQQIQWTLETVQLHDERAFRKYARLLGFCHGFAVPDTRCRLPPTGRRLLLRTAQSGMSDYLMDAASYARSSRFATRTPPLRPLTLRRLRL
jgi:hypothetical protein